MKASKGREMKRKVSEAADTSPISPDNEKVILKLQLEIARLSVENKKLIEVNKMCAEQLKEQSRLFQKIKPNRLMISAERKLYIAGEALFKCAAIHGKEKCPRWLLADGSFGAEGFEIHHNGLEWSIGYQNAGQCVAVCHSCHGLASRLHRMKLAEAGGGTEQEEEDE